MGISGIGAMGGMSAVRPADSVSKSIQNELSNAQRQKQALSSKEELSAKDKLKESQKLQQEISSLNTQLRMREEEVQKEQKKEAFSDAVQLTRDSDKIAEDNKDISIKELAEEETPVRELENIEIPPEEMEQEDINTDTEASAEDTKAVITDDSDLEQAEQRGRVITRMKDARVILKGEIEQDEARGVDAEEKRAELEKQEEKIQKASEFQFSVLGGGDKAKQAKVSGIQGTNTDNEDQAVIKAVNFAKENNAENNANAALQFFVR